MRWKQIGSIFKSPFGRSLAAILLMFTLVPILAILLLGTVAIRTQLLNRSISQLETSGNLMQDGITQWVTDGNRQLGTVLESPIVAQNVGFALTRSTDTSRIEQVLLQNLTPLIDAGYFTDIYVVNLEGTVVISSNPDYRNLSLGVTDFANAEQPYWGFDTLPLTGETTAFTWQPILSTSNETLGYMIGQLNQNLLTQILQENAVTIGETGNAYLLNQDKVAVAAVQSNLEPEFDEEINNVVEGATETYGGLANNHGDSVVASVQPLEVPINAWLVVEQDQSEAFDLLYNAIPLVTVFILLLTGLAFGAAVLTTQRITTPLQKLQRVAQDMSTGKLEARSDIERKDEFGSLSMSFNFMAKELQQSFSNLETTNQQLTSRAEQLAAITRVGQIAIEFLDLDTLLGIVAKEIQKAFNYYAVILYRPDDEFSRIEAKAAAGFASKEVIDNSMAWLIDGSNAVGTAAMTRQAVYINDFSKEKRFVPHPAQPDTKAEANIPLVVGSENLLMGVLNIQSTKIQAFTVDDLEVLQILANQIAIAIRNAELFHESEHARQLADEANQQKSDFLSNMSHELRTPLNVIIGYSHSMLTRPEMYDNADLPPVYREAIESVMSGGQHLLGLINDILDLSKIEAGRMDLELSSIDPMPILQGIRATALGLVKEGVKVRVNYPNNLPYIMGDELRVRQILLNLVSNAAKFTDQGYITLDAKVENDKLQFSVVDTGIGIPEDLQPELFTRFKQASRKSGQRRKGTGLGLSISRELTRLHGGDIWFESKLNQGTTFYFTIPLAKMPVRADGRTTDPKRPVGMHDISSRVTLFATAPNPEVLIKQIFLVDSKATSRNQLETELKNEGFDVFSADDPETALTLATTLLPDVIVLHAHEDNLKEVTNSIQTEVALASIPLIMLQDADTTETWWQSVVGQVRDKLTNKLEA